MKALPYFRKHRIAVSILAVLFVISISYVVKVRNSKAILGFGGRIIAVYPCTCVPGTATIVVGTPTPGAFLYQPATLVYPWHMITKQGSWLLGSYVPGGACMQITPVGCVPLTFPQGIISEVGTSL